MSLSLPFGKLWLGSTDVMIARGVWMRLHPTFLISPRRPSRLIWELQRATSRMPAKSGLKQLCHMFQSTASQTVQKPKLAYPPRLCVYHAGTGRVTFLACLKLSTLMIFIFFGFIATPAYYQKEGITQVVALTALSAVIPWMFVAYTTSSYVTFVHLRLAPFARQNEAMLRRFLERLPPQTQVEISTMSAFARPRVSQVPLSELVPAERRFGIVNLVRDTKAVNASRKWYMGRALDMFSARPEANRMPKVSWAWDIIYKNIVKRQQ
ncbi:hypothetical protein GGR56DRAFT_650101 [Xylariaceae sp. FL0804]|nr:hypothetical protein GGR56DRAFT_650101 [Xylariaceae sp. FL0804]